MPHLSRIAIYPVKSLGPVWKKQVQVHSSGALKEDRRWAMVKRGGRLVNGKNEPRVHQIRLADYQEGSCTFGSPLGTLHANLVEQPAEAEDYLSRFLGYPVQIRENQVTGFPDDTELAGPTLVGAASLDEVGKWFGHLPAEETWLRFRTNLEIAGTVPFWEERLYGADSNIPFKIGKVLFEGANPCARCVVPTRNPHTGEPITGFAKNFATQREATLPEWAPPNRFDHYYRFAINTVLSSRDLNSDAERFISVGDTLQLQESGSTEP